MFWALTYNTQPSMTSSDLPTKDFAAEPTTLQEAPLSLPFVVTSPTSSDQDTPMSERSLAERYTEAGLIGSGGMGEIRMMRDRNIGRSVALNASVVWPAASDAIAAELAGRVGVAVDQIIEDGAVQVHALELSQRGVVRSDQHGGPFVCVRAGRR